MNTWEHLQAAKKSLLALDKITKDADPASGITFAVRRGVARDNEDVEDDAFRRPWVTVESSNLELSGRAIALIREALIENIKFWTRRTEEDIASAQNALNSKFY